MSRITDSPEGSARGSARGTPDLDAMERSTLRPRSPPTSPAWTHTALPETPEPGRDYFGHDRRLEVEDDEDADADAATALLPSARSRRSPRRRCSPRTNVCGLKLPWVLLGLLAFPLFMVIMNTLRRHRPHPLPVFTNGTHSFHPTTLVLSLDGFRPSYLDTHADQLPHLKQLVKDGVSATMQPQFPTLTFPNHWSMLTGLHPSAHGIVANEFYRPGVGEFDYGSKETSWDGKWWGGEPLWSIAEREGRKALNFMWPGPPTTAAGISPSHFVEYGLKSPQEKCPKLLHYFDLPIDSAPSLMFMYLPDVDQAGHAAGPDSTKVSRALVRVDTFIGDLVADIQKRNMSNIIDLIVLSDHGMAALSKDRLIFLDDILGNLTAQIAHKDGWPSYGLWYNEDFVLAAHLELLSKAAETMSFTVYTHETMPESFFFKHDEHVAPLYLVPDLGWLITTHEEYDKAGGLTVFGAHGFDNRLPEMQAIFAIHGPAAERMKIHAGGEGWKSAEPAILEPFSNLEIFELVVTLQDMADLAPPTNATRGFWDKYLE